MLLKSLDIRQAISTWTINRLDPSLGSNRLEEVECLEQTTRLVVLIMLWGGHHLKPLKKPSYLLQRLTTNTCVRNYFKSRMKGFYLQFILISNRFKECLNGSSIMLELFLCIFNQSPDFNGTIAIQITEVWFFLFIITIIFKDLYTETYTFKLVGHFSSFETPNIFNPRVLFDQYILWKETIVRAS